MPGNLTHALGCAMDFRVVVLVSIITVHRKIAMNVVNQEATAYDYEDSSTFVHTSQAT